MKLYTAAQMREADRRAAAAGVPTAQLMEAAGRGVALAALSAYPATTHVAVLCGKGNNGGDGYVAALELMQRGTSVTLFELDGADGGTGDAAAARARFVAAGGQPRPLTREALALCLATPTAEPSVVIDAMFGTGLTRPLTGALAELVACLNGSGARVVAVDVPSGLNADRAEPIGPHVRADLTVELAGRKPASLFYPNRHAYGRSELLPIGVPDEVLHDVSNVNILDAAWLAPHYPALLPDAHKYSAGTVSVVAGSPRYLGAAELACRGAWRGGAGLVTLVAPVRTAASWPETVHVQHDLRSWPPPGLSVKHAASMVIGPGLTPADLTELSAMLAWAPGPVVLDATALDPAYLTPALDLAHPTPALQAPSAHHRGQQRPPENGPDGAETTSDETATAGRTRLVLTPHAGEAARLLAGITNADGGALVRRDPIAAALRIARTYHAVVVLKGPTSVVAAPSGRVAVSTAGSPAMASGGTGDVLAGLIGALAARPEGATALFERACLATWLHGTAGELAAAALGGSLLASDLVQHLPEAHKLLLR